MGDLTIKIDNVQYTLPPEAQATPNANNPNYCHPRIVYQASQDVMLIGYPFFENYVVSYDYTNGAVDFGVNTLAY